MMSWALFTGSKMGGKRVFLCVRVAIPLSILSTLLTPAPADR